MYPRLRRNLTVLFFCLMGSGYTGLDQGRPTVGVGNAERVYRRGDVGSPGTPKKNSEVICVFHTTFYIVNIQEH